MRGMLAAASLAAFMTALTACQGGGSGGTGPSPTPTASSSPTGPGGTGSGPGSTESYKISNVIVQASVGGAAGAGARSATIFFDDAKTNTPLTNHCGVGGAGAGDTKTCLCEYTWQEVNLQGSGSTGISRIAQTPLSLAQPKLAVCPVPAVYTNEIVEGTLIKVTIKPSPKNPDVFLIPTFQFAKAAAQVAASFQDIEGKSFINIRRYTCYEKLQRGLSITNAKMTVNRPNPPTGSTATSIDALVANKFCVGKPGAAAGANCSAAPESGYSTQAYYYTLYTRESNIGNVNPENDNFSCPVATEGLRESSAATTYASNPNAPWPSDATFALSLNPTTDYSVGVAAASCLQRGGDPTCVPSTCAAPAANAAAGGGGGAAGGADGGSIAVACLGFAAAPNPDGTCPYLKDTSGQLRNTYRLRRFVALYPQRFDADGAPRNEHLSMDTIYVLDRPLVASQADPKKPFTMQGPKPCPFAFFDAKGVVKNDPNQRGYYSTNDAGWNGKNVDNIYFPDKDSLVAPASCSSLIPLVAYSGGAAVGMTLGTVHSTNTNLWNYLGDANNFDGQFAATPAVSRLYVRPIKAWAPHWEEDTEFKACAPQASPFVDAPLHLVKENTGDQFGWCAETYVSRNDNASKLGTAESPYLYPYTTHNAFGTVSGSASACGYYKGSIAVVDGGDGGNNVQAIAAGVPIQENISGTSCHRTYPRIQGAFFRKFPLLAHPGDVEKAMTDLTDRPLSSFGKPDPLADQTFRCTVTFDNGGDKSKNNRSPSGSPSCCGNVTLSAGPVAGRALAAAVEGAAHIDQATSGAAIVCTPPTY